MIKKDTKKHKKFNKLPDINPYIFIVILNANRLCSSIKETD
jgi:hypothetical protein